LSIEGPVKVVITLRVMISTRARAYSAIEQRELLRATIVAIQSIVARGSPDGVLVDSAADRARRAGALISWSEMTTSQ
jgi:hypothetical protein